MMNENNFITWFVVGGHCFQIIVYVISLGMRLSTRSKQPIIPCMHSFKLSATQIILQYSENDNSIMQGSFIRLDIKDLERGCGAHIQE